MLFSKEHLSGLYNWLPQAETSVFDGNASRRLFNRWNGNQVLFIINLFLDRCGNFSIEQGSRIEKLIINKLPFNPSSEITVLNWLQVEMANA